MLSALSDMDVIKAWSGVGGINVKCDVITSVRLFSLTSLYGAHLNNVTVILSNLE